MLKRKNKELKRPMVGLEMSNPPNSRTKDFFASPALSLTLAGIFRNGAAAENVENEGGDEVSVGGGGKRDETVEISSENSGAARSEEEFDGGDEDDGDGDGDGNNKKNKKRKKYHRHTADQIREMEALFKDSPHPDEKQRQQLSKQLGLAPRQIKFWFQNRRTQIKAIQERHENSLLKNEIDKLREESKNLRETNKKGTCPNCGFASSSRDSSVSTEEQQLKIENARLKAEIQKLHTAMGKYPHGPSPSNSSGSAEKDQENRSSLDFYTSLFGLDKTRIMESVNPAMEELIKMATAGEPLWIHSVESGREILNYDVYMKEFSVESSNNSGRAKRSIEASRDTAVIFVDLPKLVQSFLDVNQWKEMFQSIISKAATVDVISHGEGPCRNGAVQLMFAELQMLTPMVPTREVYFIRFCKQLSADQWAIVDVSVDKVENNIDASLVKCRKYPSGCIIEDKANGHCKVTWVEHLECQRSIVPTMYRSIVNSGLAFGARHWISTLHQQCERLVFFMATNVPTKDSSGVATLAGRKSILKLSHRMTWSFCRSLGASSYHTWNKVASKTGEDIRVASRKNLNDPGEPLGVILCAVSSTWLPVSQHSLFDFLRDESRRDEWDVISNGGHVNSIVNLAKGQDRCNAVTVQTVKANDNTMWVLQDSSTNAYESTIIFAPIEISSCQSVMTGCDSSNVAILPSGFSILPDGIESRPLVITSQPEEKSTEGGSLLTIAFQVLINSSPTAKLSVENVDSVSSLISTTLTNIKTSLECEDC